MLTKHAAKCATLNDNGAFQNKGSPSAVRILSSASLDPSDSTYKPGAALKVTPGCAGKPMPGMNVHVVNDDGNDILKRTMGDMVLGLPLSPSSFCALWGDDERFYNSHLRRFDGRWFDTGDAGMLTDTGIQVMSCNDDVINVAAHRLSTGTLTQMRPRPPLGCSLITTGAIEQSISSHPAVAQCCDISVPDELKGHLPFAFVVTLTLQDEAQLFADIQRLVRSQEGSISSLGGMIRARQGENLIPKPRSGKMLRRNLRELVENVMRGHVGKEVNVPAVSDRDHLRFLKCLMGFTQTIEDPTAIDVARKAIQEYFEQTNSRRKAKL